MATQQAAVVDSTAAVAADMVAAADIGKLRSESLAALKTRTARHHAWPFCFAIIRRNFQIKSQRAAPTSVKFLGTMQRLTVALFCADMATMLALNLLHLPAHLTPWIFLPAVAIFFLLTPSSAQLSATPLFSTKEVRNLTLFALLFGLAMAAVRVGYLAEPFTHRLTFLVGDDPWHLQELNSLVNTPGYPAQSSFDPRHYLSFYYAPWMAAVAFYFAVPLHAVTLKTALFAVNALYEVLLPLALLDLALRAARTRLHLRWAIYLVALWSGLQSVAAVLRPLEHNSWWMLRYAGMQLQYSNFVTLMVWVIHHLCAAVALLLAHDLWQRRDALDSRGRTVVLCGFLLAFACYASAFVFLGAFAFVVMFAAEGLFRRTQETLACTALSLLLTLPLLWIYLRKPLSVGFDFPFHNPGWRARPDVGPLPPIHLHFGYVTGIGIFILLVTVQFFFVPWAVVRGWNNFARSDRAPFVFAGVFILSTYFVGFTYANNYCIRGSIVPVFILCWIAAAHLPRPSRLIVLLLALATFGSVQELGWQYLRTAAALTHPPEFLQDSAALLRLNQDRSIHQTDFDRWKKGGNPSELAPYYIEKLPLVPWPAEAVPDQELQSLGPCGLWKWERNPAINTPPCP